MFEVVYKGSRGFACEECIEKYGLIRVRKGSVPPRKKSSHQVIHRNKPITKVVKKRGLGSLFSGDIEELVEDYGVLIKRAREGMGLTQEQLAKRLGIKLSYLKKIENNLIPPSIDLARRIEKALNIKIIKRVEEEYYPLESPEEDVSGVTLGDLLKRVDGE